MPNSYFQAKILIDARVVERMRAVNDQLNGILDRGRLSPSNLVSLLLDHWQYGSPPEREWVKNQGGLYPGKGGGSW